VRSILLTKFIKSVGVCLTQWVNPITSGTWWWLYYYAFKIWFFRNSK